MRRLDPDIVLSSLVARKFDAIEIARKLGQMEYRGSYRILVNDIPNPDLVLQEVFNVAPYLDCDIIDFAAVFPSN